MVHEAEEHSAEDKERRQRVEAHNQLDSLVYTTEKTFDEHKEKLAPEAIGEIESALAEAKTALESEDLDTIKKATDKLSQASHRVAEVMYQQSGAQGPEAAESADAGATAGAGDEDEVIDAEYVDVDESKS